MIRQAEGDVGGKHLWSEIHEIRRSDRERWAIRAAQWRALELARAVFGEGASGRLGEYPPRGAFRGLIHLEVPFREMEDHRARETRFQVLAARDPVLRQVPLVFALDPRPDGVAGSAGP